MQNHSTPEIPYGYCACGCGQKTPIAKKTDRRYGHIKGRPIQYLNHHHNLLSDVDYTINPETGCWEWQRGKNSSGYGLTGGTVAHRLYYIEQYGDIPEGIQLDHLCRNRACVNPDHLEPVTNAINSRRGARTRLTPVQVEQIRSLFGRESVASLSIRFGISKTHVYDIVNGDRWSDDK